MSRYSDPKRSTPLHLMTHRDMEAAERRVFARDERDHEGPTDLPSSSCPGDGAKGRGDACPWCGEWHESFAYRAMGQEAA